ncbi:MAG: hypothetical protein A2381_09025 [Bdellovibrionales bacterium RIFOXYB1_FULL_37_110]|nr:MAG: hypothetical protein A2181_09215 [Bdellovibrionales bacterium RIFOXYA1_FULL_38_20]OFZ46413.1 MAG: hypothetical protein A2417_09125 [Bdellovibrionales bacterium RIFOXYC1_FULL_37_79]OFZ60977.1 MAG: hypothetical protein A2381_09025 [Bdellovibrionales bacterium RIFOXYB1_FULL_37_110]OFZ63721.1 MAG: hypothetical protein A2577_08145 [Bdellovibrionales bacterium RIFOXYD1_FULL_36_51]OFZ65802.1 MAG: hypothetical protein A2328_05185 [Bdellovibrionales bacterium RIFOXYB2_FULL_36_6]
MAKKIVLGKGIASLIQDTNHEIVSNTLEQHFGEEKESELVHNPTMVSVNEIKTNPNQPRKIFKEKELEELSNSIRENGIIQPLIVRKAEQGFELIAGERRLRAAIKAKLEYVPVIVKRVTDREKLILSIIENVQRADLNCIEEALAYYQLMDDFNLTQEELAKQIGKERSTVANFLRILKLPRNVIDLIQKDFLSFGHAKVLAALKDQESVSRYANLAATNEMSVRELEELIKKGSKITKNTKPNQYFDEKIDQLKQILEQNTGFHFQIKNKSNGSGEIVIKYNNEAGFNDIFDYLLRKK